MEDDDNSDFEEVPASRDYNLSDDDHMWDGEEDEGSKAVKRAQGERKLL